MERRNKNWNTLVITAALVFVVRLSVYEQNTGFFEILKNEHYSRIKHAVFDISGTVTDVNGKKLDGVSVSITLDRPKNIWATDSED